MEFARSPKRRTRIAIVVAIIVAAGGLTSAIRLLPGAELLRQSIRANLDTSSHRDGSLMALPPIPAVLLFLLVSVRRLARERIGVPVDRLIEEAR